MRMTREQLMNWAADHYAVAPNCEGSPDEALMAGWENAMDIQDERQGNMTDEEFTRIAYSEYDNMKYGQD